MDLHGHCMAVDAACMTLQPSWCIWDLPLVVIMCATEGHLELCPGRRLTGLRGVRGQGTRVAMVLVLILVLGCGVCLGSVVATEMCGRVHGRRLVDRKRPCSCTVGEG